MMKCETIDNDAHAFRMAKQCQEGAGAGAGPGVGGNLIKDAADDASNLSMATRQPQKANNLGLHTRAYTRPGTHSHTHQSPVVVGNPLTVIS